jgi:hypothetical protein
MRTGSSHRPLVLPLGQLLLGEEDQIATQEAVIASSSTLIGFPGIGGTRF